jgi:hypothetical protein
MKRFVLEADGPDTEWLTPEVITLLLKMAVRGLGKPEVEITVKEEKAP